MTKQDICIILSLQWIWRLTVIIAFELRKENKEIHGVTRSEEGYVFLGKQWLTRNLVYRALVVDAANILFYWYQQNAVTIIQNLFDELKGIVEEGKATVNALVATKQLESFAINYATVHFTENQSGNFSKENYGT